MMFIEVEHTILFIRIEILSKRNNHKQLENNSIFEGEVKLNLLIKKHCVMYLC